MLFHDGTEKTGTNSKRNKLAQIQIRLAFKQKIHMQ